MPMQRQTHVAVWLRMLAQQEIRAARSAKKLLGTQGKATKKAFNEGGQLKAEQAIRQGHATWVRTLIAVYTVAIRNFAEYTQEQLGMKSKANFLDLVAGFISREAFNKATYITGTSIELARNAIISGVENGLSETEIAKQLNSVIGGGLSTSRARTIARTEVHNAATFGMQAQAEQSEQLLIREWVSVHDERTRDIDKGDQFSHVQMDGVRVGMDEPFAVPNADGSVELIDRPGEGSPGNAINCRCTLLYVPQDTEF